MLFETGRKTQHLVFLFVGKGDDLRHGRLCIGQCAGFVKHDGVGLCHGLKKTAAFNRNVIFISFPHGRKHGYGHGKLERTGKNPP